MNPLSISRPVLKQGWMLIVSLVCFGIASCTTQPNSVQDLLAKIPQIDSMRQFEGDTVFSESWELWFSQPVDHENPKGARFPQLVIYNHKDFAKPMVVSIEGYKLFSPYADEPTLIFDANQLIIEHRFFDKSRPGDSIPWDYLTIYQAATDQHKIIKAFKPFYPNKWISTGISKGGQATIFHRFFYPKDVDVSIPYVAPLAYSNEDPRVYSFLNRVGTEECRTRIKSFQKELFKRKETLLPLLVEFSKSINYTFHFGIEKAYEINVLEYNFAFWQWSGLNCDQIPDSTASDIDLFTHWIRVAPFDFIEDKGVEDVRPFFYQAMTEIGMYGYDVKPWREYLSDSSNITFDFTMPPGHKAIFNPKSVQSVNRWVQTQGNNMLYIYGEYDPWTATAVEISDKTNSKRFINPKGDHTSRINSFPTELRDSIYSTLEAWLKLEMVKY